MPDPDAPDLLAEAGQALGLADSDLLVLRIIVLAELGHQRLVFELSAEGTGTPALRQADLDALNFSWITWMSNAPAQLVYAALDTVRNEAGPLVQPGLDHRLRWLQDRANEHRRNR